ncbi:MAG TPA: cupredoxin domain-containing protein [Acidimicrobiia bacterium]|nr:cupredoxin domain-containing protein [Acidimicrobiia bacterium]
MRMRTLALITGIAIVAACGGDDQSTTTAGVTGPTSAGDGPILTIEGRSFGSVPDLAPGESMTIVNLDSVRHTFTSGDDAWESVELPGDSEASFTVPAELAPGDYIFFCEVHADMGGRLTVTG